ncbi:MAG: AMP-binding protein [Actinomycetota bacterium]
MTLRDSQRLIHKELERAASEVPDLEWLCFLDYGTKTLEELWTEVRGFAASLQELGIEKGDRIALMVGNRPEFVTAWFATQLVGAISVPLNTAFRGNVLTHMLELVEPKVAICEAASWGRIDDAWNSPEPLSKGIVLSDESGAKPGGARRIDRFVDFDDLMVDGSPDVPEMQPWDSASVMYTSGTTGPSKGVIWTHNFTMHVGEVCVESMRYTSDDALYTSLPLFHGNALNTSLIPALLARAPLVVGERFSASRFWSEVSHSGATETNILGAMSAMLLKQPESPDERTHNLRTALVIPAAPEIYEVFQKRFGITPIEAYGLSDAGLLLWTPPDEEPRPGSCGLPTRGFDCRLVNEDDEEVSRGDIGELVIRPSMPWITNVGYWGMPDATVRAWRNFWFHTGDLMRQDADGWFYFVDRAKDAIRRRGENVSSYEVEQALLLHDGVIECAAYGIVDELGEEEVAIAIVAGEDFSPDSVIDYLEPKLPYFAVPRYVRFVPELPKTETEKILKQSLKAEGVTTDTWDRVAAGRTLSR